MDGNCFAVMRRDLHLMRTRVGQPRPAQTLSRGSSDSSLDSVSGATPDAAPNDIFLHTSLLPTYQILPAESHAWEPDTEGGRMRSRDELRASKGACARREREEARRLLVEARLLMKTALAAASAAAHVTDATWRIERDAQARIAKLRSEERPLRARHDVLHARLHEGHAVLGRLMAQEKQAGRLVLGADVELGVIEAHAAHLLLLRRSEAGSSREGAAGGGGSEVEERVLLEEVAGGAGRARALLAEMRGALQEDRGSGARRRDGAGWAREPPALGVAPIHHSRQNLFIAPREGAPHVLERQM